MIVRQFSYCNIVIRRATITGTFSWRELCAVRSQKEETIVHTVFISISSPVVFRLNNSPRHCFSHTLNRGLSIGEGEWFHFGQLSKRREGHRCAGDLSTIRRTRIRVSTVNRQPRTVNNRTINPRSAGGEYMWDFLFVKTLLPSSRAVSSRSRMRCVRFAVATTCATGFSDRAGPRQPRSSIPGHAGGR